MLDVLCGVLLFGLGYVIGRQRKEQPKPNEPTEEQQKAEKEYRQQMDGLLRFQGRRTKPNG
jgi:hypothetical protein